MGIYRQTNGISVVDAYRIFETEWLTRHENDDMLREMLPSLDRVRRALAKLPLHIREFGRLTGSKYKVYCLMLSVIGHCLRLMIFGLVTVTR